MKYQLIPVRMVLIKKKKITNTGEDMEKREPLCTVGESVTGHTHSGKQYEGSSRN